MSVCKELVLFHSTLYLVHHMAFSHGCAFYRFATMFLGWSMESGLLFRELCVLCFAHPLKFASNLSIREND